MSRATEARADAGLQRRTIRNTCVYVAPVDWVDVLAGTKTEIRKYGHAGGLPDRTYPCPCVFYTRRASGPPATAMGLLKEQWCEPLGAITPESLTREGFADYDAFRRYFALRYPKGGFRPLAKVIVQRVGPLGDPEPWKDWLWAKLYGDLT